MLGQGLMDRSLTKWRLQRARRRDPDGFGLAERIRSERLTFLQVEPLLDLRNRVRELESRATPGAIVEAGCALGGSAIMLAASKAPERPLHVFDTFGMIPPPSDVDGVDVRDRYEVIASGEAKGFDGDTYYGYLPDLKERVRDSFARLGYPVDANHVRLIEGLFEDTLHPEEPVALAHIDGDWYESVKVCLDRIWPMLSPGGVMVIDDYDSWSGCKTAVDEFLSTQPQCRVERRSRLHLIRGEAHS